MSVFEIKGGVVRHTSTPLMVRPRPVGESRREHLLRLRLSRGLQHIRAFGLGLLHKLIMLRIPAGRSSLNHVGDPFGSHRAIEGRERRAHGLREPGQHLLQRAVCRFHMEPAPREPFR